LGDYWLRLLGDEETESGRRLTKPVINRPDLLRNGIDLSLNRLRTALTPPATEVGTVLVPLVAEVNTILSQPQTMMTTAPPVSNVPPVSETRTRQPRPRGRPGRRSTYSPAVLEFAFELLRQDPDQKLEAIRIACRRKFGERGVPPDYESFRSWLRRNRSK
jgi:hypothetical protein